MGIRLGMGLLPLVAVGVFLAAMRFYPLGKEQVAELRGRLEALHGQRRET
jgi:Na+/melibiose symporter-like transporter